MKLSQIVHKNIKHRQTMSVLNIFQQMRSSSDSKNIDSLKMPNPNLFDRNQDWDDLVTRKVQHQRYYSSDHISVKRRYGEHECMDAKSEMSVLAMAMWSLISVC